MADKTVRVAVFAVGDKVEQAIAAGADVVDSVLALSVRSVIFVSVTRYLPRNPV